MTEPTFEYRIRRSNRVQRARIVVTPAKIEVVAPPAMRESRIHNFVQEKRGWIVAALGKIAQQLQQTRSLFTPTHIGDGALIPFRGRRYPLRTQPTQLKRIKIEFGEHFLAHIPHGMAPELQRQKLQEALIRWLRQRAEEDAHRLLAPHIPRCNLQPRSINIRTQKSRWGSCGIRNDIQLNWLLILAPPEVYEYVLVHEICHIRHKNHSRDFWQLVAEHLPDYKQRRAWLKTHGAGLMQGL